ncbi:MAG: glycosyltransferase family 2 protein, partial [Elusimicrobia bacterium]|nr:glycosyltransferase family 2 protein [Elusimicrobiota bacterium]
MEQSAVSVVVPSFNEEDGIADVVAGLRRALAGREHEILVVDDGSSDATAARAKAAGASVVQHPVNRGYGRALVTGLAAAKHPWVLMIDGDGSYPPEEARVLLDAAEGFDMVVGTRSGKLFWGSPHQALLRWIYLWLAGFVVGEAVPDANSGLRLFRQDAFARSMPFLCLGYSFSTTMTLSFLQSGRFVRWVPIRFAARTGRSKVKPLRDILRTLQVMTQVMVYYNPLKLCATLAGAAGLAGLAAGAALWAEGA